MHSRPHLPDNIRKAGDKIFIRNAFDGTSKKKTQERSGEESASLRLPTALLSLASCKQNVGLQYRILETGEQSFRTRATFGEYGAVDGRQDVIVIGEIYAAHQSRWTFAVSPCTGTSVATIKNNGLSRHHE